LIEKIDSSPPTASPETLPKEKPRSSRSDGKVEVKPESVSASEPAGQPRLPIQPSQPRQPIQPEATDEADALKAFPRPEPRSISIYDGGLTRYRCYDFQNIFAVKESPKR
jgi:hypothetical protein